MVLELRYRIKHATAASESNCRFVTTGERALRNCSGQHEHVLDERFYTLAKNPGGWIRAIFQFRIYPILILTTRCAVAAALGRDFAEFAMLYLLVLLVVVPAYVVNMYRAIVDNDKNSSWSALRVPITISIAFGLAMCRGEIRGFYPQVLWPIPGLLLLAAGLALHSTSNRFLLKFRYLDS